MNSELKLTVFLILICSSLLTGGFIYSTYDDPFDEEVFGFTRSTAYIMLGFASLMIFILFWGFIYCAGNYQLS